MDRPSPPPSPDERERIIAGAWTVLGRSGFDGFKVQLVLRESGLSARRFYQHFSGKSELLLALMEEELRRTGALLVSVLDRVPDPAAKVEAWVGTLLAGAAAPSRAARARHFTTLANILREFPDEYAAASQAVVNPLREAIVEGRARGDFPHADVESDTQAIYALCGAFLTSCVDDPGRYPVGPVTAVVTSFALRALRSPG